MLKDLSMTGKCLFMKSRLNTTILQTKVGAVYYLTIDYWIKAWNIKYNQIQTRT